MTKDKALVVAKFFEAIQEIDVVQSVKVKEEPDGGITVYAEIDCFSYETLREVVGAEQKATEHCPAIDVDFKVVLAGEDEE